MYITIKDAISKDKKNHVVEVEPKDTILSIKIKIQTETGVPPEEQKFIFAGSEMPNEKTLLEYAFAEESVIHMIRTVFRLQINFKTPSGDVFQFSLEKNSTIQEIKQKINEKIGNAQGDFILQFSGIPLLDDSATLLSCSIPSNSTIDLCFSPPVQATPLPSILSDSPPLASPPTNPIPYYGVVPPVGPIHSFQPFPTIQTSPPFSHSYPGPSTSPFPHNAGSLPFSPYTTSHYSSPSPDPITAPSPNAYPSPPSPSVAASPVFPSQLPHLSQTQLKQIPRLSSPSPQIPSTPPSPLPQSPTPVPALKAVLQPALPVADSDDEDSSKHSVEESEGSVAEPRGFTLPVDSYKSLKAKSIPSAVRMNQGIASGKTEESRAIPLLRNEECLAELVFTKPYEEFSDEISLTHLSQEIEAKFQIQGHHLMIIASRSVYIKFKSKENAETFGSSLSKNREFVQTFGIDLASTLERGKFKKLIKAEDKQHEWCHSQASSLILLIHESMKFSHCDYVVTDVLALDSNNPPFFQENLEDARLLFKGLSSSNFCQAMSQNPLSDLRGATKPFGNGVYFTSFPACALQKLSMLQHNSDDAILLASYVKVRKAKQIEDLSFQNREIDDGYDSHYVRTRNFIPVSRNDEENLVESCSCGAPLQKCTFLRGSEPSCCVSCTNAFEHDAGFLQCPRGLDINHPDHMDKGFAICEDCHSKRNSGILSDSSHGNHYTPLYDEWVVPNQAANIQPRFLIKLKKIQKIFIWRNTTFEAYQNLPLYDILSKHNVIYLCKDNLTALQVLQVKDRANTFLILNGRDSEYFLKEKVLQEYRLPARHVLIYSAFLTAPTLTWVNNQVKMTKSLPDVERFVSENGYSPPKSTRAKWFGLF